MLFQDDQSWDQLDWAEAPDAANTAAKAAPARSLNFIIRALSLPSVLRPIDPTRLISRPVDCVSVTEATLRPQIPQPREARPGRYTTIPLVINAPERRRLPEVTG